MTTAPKEDTYSGVIDHENVRLALLIAEFNELEVMAVDIGNVYLLPKPTRRSTLWLAQNLGPS